MAAVVFDAVADVMNGDSAAIFVYRTNRTNCRIIHLILIFYQSKRKSTMRLNVNCDCVLLPVAAVVIVAAAFCLVVATTYLLLT